METRNDEVLTVKQLSQRLAISERTVANWIRQRGLPVVRIGKSVRFVWAHVRAWLDEQTSRGGGNPGCGGVVVG
jgi:excisionase family DNA binding protein